MHLPTVPLHLSRLARIVARIFTQFQKYGVEYDPASPGSDGDPAEIVWDECVFVDQSEAEIKKARRLSFRGLVFVVRGDVLCIEAKRRADLVGGAADDAIRGTCSGSSE